MEKNQNFKALLSRRDVRILFVTSQNPGHGFRSKISKATQIDNKSESVLYVLVINASARGTALSPVFLSFWAIKGF